MQTSALEKGERTSRTAVADEWFRWDRMLGDLGRMAIAEANLRKGSIVIDVGCGAGGSTLDAASVVGDGGRALGIDLDHSAVTVARARARAEGFRSAEFIAADASRNAHGSARADAVISRFGNLFFPDPSAAHLHLAGALKAGGRIAFLAPRELERNLWSALPMRVVSRVLGKPALSTAAFGFADPRRIVSVLEKAGFEQVRMESVDKPLCVGADLDDAIDFFAKTDGKELFAALDSSKITALLDGLTRALSPYVGERGVFLPASTWLVSACVR